MKLRITRDLGPDEHYDDHEVHETIEAGSIVYACFKPTYGCIGFGGIAVTWDPDGDYPFFEVPRDALEVVPDARDSAIIEGHPIGWLGE